MEAHLTQVLKGIARSRAPSGLKKALSFEAVRLASKERVQQRLLLGLRAADGGSVEGSFEDSVSNGIQRRTVEQIVDLLAPVFPDRLSKCSTVPGQSGNSQGAPMKDRTNDDRAAATAADARPPEIVKQSATMSPALLG